MATKKQDTSSKPALSVVVPVKNEADNIVSLVTEIDGALKDGFDYEIVYVDDGSDDNSQAVFEKTKEQFPRFTVVRHEKSCGQSQAIATGVKYAKSPLIATLDGDGQNDPADLPALYEKWAAQDDKENVLIAGHRHKRKDTELKKISSKLANGIRKTLLNDDTPDTGCGTKIFPQAAFLDMPRFDHMHRYLPALMIRRGGRVMSVHVNHRPREAGVSKYGFWDRLLVGVSDLAGVFWLMRRASVPVVTKPLENKK